MIQAIQNGDLRDPARPMGYVRTRQAADAASIEAAVNRRRTQVDFEDSLFSLSVWKDDPEQSLVAQQQGDIARKVLGENFRTGSRDSGALLCS